MDKLLTPQEVADRLGVKATTVLNMALDGRIPRVKLGRRIVRFEWDKVKAALDATQKK
jgi:excisionase family DNA binding protein